MTVTLARASIKQLRSTNDWLLISADFPNFSRQELFAYFTQADLLPKWWSPNVPELDLSVGGKYHLAWSTMNWHLRGTYTAVERHKILAFSWKWDHAPELPMRNVCVMFTQRQAGAASLMIIHGTYGDDESEQNDRQGHLDGWTHFLGQLQMVKA